MLYGLRKQFNIYAKNDCAASSPEQADKKNVKDAPKDVLLHCCCGPCAEYPIKDMGERGYKISLYFFNPNIHPQGEWQRRFESMQKLADLRELPFFYDEAFMLDEWLGYEKLPQTTRCGFCYVTRLEQAAEKAKVLGIPSFTTSLLVSPYQNREVILAAGKRAGAKFGVDFLEEDFRPGFREGQNMAIADGLYRQKFCGCIFSLLGSKFKERVKRELEIDLLPGETPPPDFDSCGRKAISADEIKINIEERRVVRSSQGEGTIRSERTKRVRLTVHEIKSAKNVRAVRSMSIEQKKRPLESSHFKSSLEGAGKLSNKSLKKKEE